MQRQEKASHGHIMFTEKHEIYQYKDGHVYIACRSDILNKFGYRISGRFLTTMEGWQALKTAIKNENKGKIRRFFKRS